MGGSYWLPRWWLRRGSPAPRSPLSPTAHATLARAGPERSLSLSAATFAAAAVLCLPASAGVVLQQPKLQRVRGRPGWRAARMGWRCGTTIGGGGSSTSSIGQASKPPSIIIPCLGDG